MKDIPISLKFLHLNATSKDLEIFNDIKYLKYIKDKKASYFSKMPDLKKLVTSVLSKEGHVLRATASHTHNFKISARDRKIGICVQMGNHANFAFDILKLNEAKKNKIISRAVCFVPTQRTEKFVGSGNCATWERIYDHKDFYSDHLTLPALICGLDLLD